MSRQDGQDCLQSQKYNLKSLVTSALTIIISGSLLGCESGYQSKVSTGEQPNATGGPPSGPSHKVLYGFTNFLYDDTEDATGNTETNTLGKGLSLSLSHSTIYFHHAISCVTWLEELMDAETNPATLAEWASIKAALDTSGFKGALMLTLTPTKGNRVALNNDCQSQAMGNSYSELEKASPGFSAKMIDDPMVMDLYYKYVVRMIEYFGPQYVDLGYKMGFDLAKDPYIWQRYVAIHTHVFDKLKVSHPEVQLTFSTNAYVLRSKSQGGPSHGELIKPFLEDYTDFLGVSYFPDSGQMSQGFYTSDPYGDGRQGWLDMLKYLHDLASSLNKTKQVAILETGYSTLPVDLAPFYQDMTIVGSEISQKQWIEDLISEAKKQNYLLVNWSTAIDYEPIWNKMPGDTANPQDTNGLIKQLAMIKRNMGLWRIPMGYPISSSLPVASQSLEAWAQGWELR
ncbi:MAG: hypothetical protein H6624_05905 [Bdellovibrionaceae bacterium]|nr:hypothetical protein [Bdellovibrionales bacterium]MCB9083856.1 hypothetical protein [Pseudobdellovibrionaceae bacterium]